MIVPIFNKIHHYPPQTTNPVNLKKVSNAATVKLLIRKVFKNKPTVFSSQHMVLELQKNGFQVQKRLVQICLNNNWEFIYKPGNGWITR